MSHFDRWFKFAQSHWYGPLLALAIDMLFENLLVFLGTSRLWSFVVATPLHLVVLSLAATRLRSRNVVLRALAGFYIAWLLLYPDLNSIQRDAHGTEVFIILGPVLVIMVVLIVFAAAQTLGESTGGTQDEPTFRRSANSHFNTDGTDKIAYSSVKEATSEAQRLGKKDGVTMNTYECGTCKKIHVGHG